jgi:hypothetical protein
MYIGTYSYTLLLLPRTEGEEEEDELGEALFLSASREAEEPLLGLDW